MNQTDISTNNQDNCNALIKLEEHLQFQSLLAELSANFIRVPADSIDQEIQESLRRIAENLGLDSVSLGLITADGQDLYSKYRYSKPGKRPWEASSLMSEGPFLTKTLLAGQPFIMHDVEALPAEGAVDREGFLSYDTRAALIFPFNVGGHLCGGISFASSEPRQWPDHVIQGLRLMADVFANILERKSNFQALQDKEEQMRLAAEAADIGLWAWNISQDTIWATDRAREIYGVSYADKLNLQRFLSCLHPEDYQRIKKVVENAFQSGSDFREEYRIVHPDGAEYWICATGKCQYGDSGRPERMMGANLNITDIRQTKRELERSNAELKKALEEISSLKDRVLQENIYLRSEITERRGFRTLNNSAAMRPILTLIQQVGPTPASVLITGETGTGKELLATAIHEASPRKDKSMIKVNCAAIPVALIESELFGREKGAYTGALSKQIGRFELADGSTLFLDEVGELPLEAQSKLLRVLQEKQIERLGNPKPISVDVRVIAATNRNLTLEVAEGRFREDLYYRLNVFPIQIPPLRDRREDIPKLVEVFIQEFANEMDKSIDGIDKTSMKMLCAYDWPGNIREMRNVIERAVILAQGPIIKITLPNDSLAKTLSTTSTMASLEQVERDYIIRVLESCSWRVRGESGAAEILGINPNTLESRMYKLGIHRPSKP